MRLLRLLVVALLGLGCSAGPPSAEHAPPEQYPPEFGAIRGKTDGPPVPKKLWTFLYYGAGDNNLAPFVEQNVNDLESVGSTDQVNLIAYLDLPGGARRYYLTRDDDPTRISSVSASLGEFDTGDPENLVNALAWARETFPSYRFGVVLSGHGGGRPRLVLPDESSGHAMSVPDLWAALQRLQERMGEPQFAHLFGVDACLMATLETGAEIRDRVFTLVGSENVEEGEGWAYARIAQSLVNDPAQDDVDLGRTIVTSYREQYASDREATLAAIHAGWFQWLGEPYARFTTDLINYLQLSPANRALVQEVARQVTAFQDYIDVYSFVSMLRERVNNPALQASLAEVQGYFDRMIIQSSVGQSLRARGISVYLPAALDREALDTYRQQRFARETGWDRFIEVYLGGT